MMNESYEVAMKMLAWPSCTGLVKLSVSRTHLHADGESMQWPLDLALGLEVRVKLLRSLNSFVEEDFREA